MRDEATDVMLHVYGPHIFHTNSLAIWTYLAGFGERMPFTHRVKASTRRGVFGFPIKPPYDQSVLRATLGSERGKEFLGKLGEKGIAEPASFEEQALRPVGPELYETFLKGYTQKQWGVEAIGLAADVKLAEDSKRSFPLFPSLPRSDGRSDILPR